MYVAYHIFYIFNTGTLGGGMYGGIQGWQRAQGTTIRKLQVNSVLNGMGKKGAATASTMASFGIFFAKKIRVLKTRKGFII